MSAKNDFDLMARIAPLAYEILHDEDLKKAKQIVKDKGDAAELIRIAYPALFERHADSLFDIYAAVKGISREDAENAETADMLKFISSDPVFKMINDFFPSAVRLALLA